MSPEITSKGQKVSLEIKLGYNLKNEKNYGKEKISKRHKEYLKLYQVVPTTPHLQAADPEMAPARGGQTDGGDRRGETGENVAGKGKKVKKTKNNRSF